MQTSEFSSYRIGHFLVRAGIAFSFLYPPFAALTDPIAWSGYFPIFVQSLPLETTLLLHAFGVLEVGIALWLLWGRSIRIPSILAAVLLLSIVLVNLNDLGVLFRDVALALAALALAFLPEPARTV